MLTSTRFARTAILATLFSLGAFTLFEALPTPTLAQQAPAWPGDQLRLVYTRPEPAAGQDVDLWEIGGDGSNKRQLTKIPGEQRRPDVSPDGLKIAYVSVIDGNQTLWIANRDGSNPSQIPVVLPNGYVSGVVWSPDSRQLTFTSSAEDWWEIWVVNADGTHARRLTTNVPAAGDASWCPDSEHLIFGVEPAAGFHDLYTVRRDGTGQRLFVSARETGYSNYFAIWSPNSTQIATLHWQAGQIPGRRDLWLMNADGSGGHTLVEDIEPFKQRISWTPDGNWLVFGKGGQIWRVRRDGSDAAPITADGGWEASIAPDAPRADDIIVYARPKPYFDLNADIWRMNGDGSHQQQLTQSSQDESGPKISPNGKKIAYVTHSSATTSGLWVMDVDGANPHQLTSEGATFRPAWSPDGSKIAYSHNLEDWWEIWVINADGTNPRRLTTYAPAAGDPSWSPDGQKIIFNLNPGQGYEDLYLMNSDGTNQRMLLASAATGYSYRYSAWAPDGTQIVTMRYPAGFPEARFDLWLANADGSQGRVLVEGVEGRVNAFSWSADGQWIIFGKNGQIWRVRRNGSFAAPITTDDGWEPSIGHDSSAPPFPPTTTPPPTATATPSPAITPTPSPTRTPASDCTLTINDGAKFTNQLDVELTMEVGSAAQMQVSNDGGFGGTAWQPYQRTISWTLEDPGPRLATQLVFSRFVNSRASTLCGGQVIDSIIYDPLPPTVTVRLESQTATAPQQTTTSQARLKIAAADQPGGSGVAGLQISTHSDFAGAAWQAFADTIQLPAQPGATIYVRARDSAGNISAATSVRLSTSSETPQSVYLALIRW